jgi:hypothetical protein
VRGCLESEDEDAAGVGMDNVGARRQALDFKSSFFCCDAGLQL